MKKITLSLAAAALLFTAGCKKSSSDNATAVTETAVINDFVNKLLLPQYQSFLTKATTLNTAVNTLNTAPTNANLEAARTAWRDVRSTWEQCEGFLIGPVKDDNYDPNMDTWPVDYLQLDSFITSSSSFPVETVQALSQSLRGFHPLEFILWGQNGTATVDSINTKQKQYMVSLSQDILNNVTKLNNSWAASGDNYQAKLLNAGNGSTLFPTRQSAMLAMVAGMADICDEVGGGKIKEPFDAYDSTKAESPFSHNSITDFTNNMKGAQNIYLCTYGGQTGSSMSAFVAKRNISLDNKIKTQFATAIAALGNVSANFELAIFNQRLQLQAAMDAINTLQATLDGDLKTFVTTYVKD